MAAIFLSFIHEELQLARSVKTLLERDFGKGSVFMSDDIDPGEDWMKEIRSAIRSSRVVVLLLSPSSIKRPWINFEAGAAWFNEKKKIISLTYGGLGDLQKPYGDLQAINLGAHPERLAPAVAKHLRQETFLVYRPGDKLYVSIEDEVRKLQPTPWEGKRRTTRPRLPAKKSDSRHGVGFVFPSSPEVRRVTRQDKQPSAEIATVEAASASEQVLVMLRLAGDSGLPNRGHRSSG